MNLLHSVSNTNLLFDFTDIDGWRIMSTLANADFVSFPNMDFYLSLNQCGAINSPMNIMVRWVSRNFRYNATFVHIHHCGHLIIVSGTCSRRGGTWFTWLSGFVLHIFRNCCMFHFLIELMLMGLLRFCYVGISYLSWIFGAIASNDDFLQFFIDCLYMNSCVYGWMYIFTFWYIFSAIKSDCSDCILLLSIGAAVHQLGYWGTGGDIRMLLVWPCSSEHQFWVLLLMFLCFYVLSEYFLFLII